MTIRFNCGLGWYIVSKSGEILASQFDSKEECELKLKEIQNENDN